ncbi:MAG: hypothetical protein R3F59_14025 [Myxococcota bacterium]
MPTLALIALLLPTAAHAGFDASSHKKEDKLGKNFWAVASALDSNPETCWQNDPEQSNNGSWLYIDVPGGEVDKIGMIIGWQKSEDTFFDYARIKSAKVEVYNLPVAGDPVLVATHDIAFADKPGWQYGDIPDVKISGEGLGGRVKITVTDTYPGKDYPNLAVSEVRVHLKEFEAASMQLARPFDTGGETADKATDGNAKTFWTGSGTQATFAVKAGGYGLSSLGLQSGPKAYARPKTVELTVNGATGTQTLEDKPGQMQWLLLPTVIGFTGGAWGDVDVKILDAYPGDVPTNGLAIAEVKMNAGSISDF